MSFMFHPYPYDDPHAVNDLSPQGIPLGDAVKGNDALAVALVGAAAQADHAVIAVDGYTTAPFLLLHRLLERRCREEGISLTVLDTLSLLRPAAELDREIAETYLPEAREKDPVLLYGRLLHQGYDFLFDPALVADCVDWLGEGRGGITLLIGPGALCPAFRPHCHVTVFADVTQKATVFNMKRGDYRNIGCGHVLPYKLMARRSYYIDNEAAAQVRGQIMAEGGPDFYIAADDTDAMTLLPRPLLSALFDRAMEYPLRCKPVYLEGVWGGYNIMSRRNLPRKMKNCAWVFDMIPMEVSIVFRLEEEVFEFPFYTLVQARPEQLMGRRSVERLGPYFPVRFNYDDTFHASGNMSIQCHPGEEYVKAENGELGRQDESYYIVEAAQGAKTYLGFRKGADVEEFLAKARESEQTGQPVDYEKYVYAVDSVPGTQVMIPAGTIHASGRNQLILEIGSLTVGSYTYKVYDYVRKDLDGKPRPIHSYHADKVLVRERDGDWVMDNVVTPPQTPNPGRDWEERTVGEHDLLYFSLRNILLEDRAEQDTAGDFHVLALVDGEQVEIRSKSDPTRRFISNYLDIVVVPAVFGPYEVVNRRPGTRAVLHKTVLKEDL